MSGQNAPEAKGVIDLKVLAINGSPRKKGNLDVMIGVAAEQLKKARIRVERLSLADYEIGPCNACERCSKKTWDCPIRDDAIEVLRRMVRSDGIMIGSPVYFSGVTAQLKALFDRSYMISWDFMLRDKVGGALSCGGGSHGGQELTVTQIIAFFLQHNMMVAGAEGGLLGAMGTGSDRGDVRSDSAALKEASALGKRMAEMLQRASGGKRR